jgi:hypothetical protein
MSTITAILEPDADGTLHLPLPEELRRGKVEVTTTLKPAGGGFPDSAPSASLKGFGCLHGKISMSQDFDAPLEDFRDYRE